MKSKRIIALILSALVLVAVSVSALVLPAAAADADWIERTAKDSSTYAYSIAVIGDTQSLSISDVKNAATEGYEPRLEKIYDWIVNNKENKKIGLVMGLGDIVETWQSPLDYPNSGFESTHGAIHDAEWANAAEQISKLDGVVPYTLVRGNHDSDLAFNTWVKNSMQDYTSQFTGEGTDAGFYTDANGNVKYDTSYMTLTLGTTDWLIVTLDWGATTAEIDWVKSVISAENHSNHSVILSMHSYLYHDRTVDGKTGSADSAFPNPDWDYSIDPTSPDLDPDLVFNPDGIWERLVSKHSNIKLVLSGHTANKAPQTSQLIGDNGNTVTQMLVDPQSMDLDSVNAGGCGMVCMLYFMEDGSLANTSEWDGSNVDVEWYSTIKDRYYKEANQFSLDFNLYDGGESTVYGTIPAKYTDTEAYPFVTFCYDEDIDEYFFLGAYSEWAGTTGAYPSLSAVSGVSKNADAYILLRRNYTYTEKAYAMGKLTVTANLDLGGYTITTGNNQFFSTNLGSAGTKSTLNVFGKEGSAFLTTSSYRPFISLGADSTGTGADFTYNFKGIKFGFAEGGTTPTLIAQTFNMAASDTAITTSQTINLEDCIIDLKTNAPDKKITLFQLDETVGSGYNVQAANVTIKGGSIIAGNYSNVQLFSKNDTDSFAFDTSDSATALYLDHGASAPTASYNNTEGKTVSFLLSEEGEAQDKYLVASAPTGSKGEIDVWLIAGQSNASGYGSDTLTDSLTNNKYLTGFDNILYYGSGDGNIYSEFTPLTIGMGRNQSSVGAEVGIASMLGGSDRMNAVIKLGRGSAYLYPNTTHDVSINFGTWTSPSYISNNNINTEGTKIGGLYASFMDTVQAGVDALIAEGYTPVIKGVWWMQGEAESNQAALANEYEDLLTCLISDMREDLGEIFDSNCSDMPFVMGSIYRNRITDVSGNFVHTQPAYLSVINESQLKVASQGSKIFVVDSTGLPQIDGWHFTADAQQYLGEQFVSRVIEADGKYSVSLDGKNVILTGGGIFSEGEKVTVTVTPSTGFVIKGVTYKVADGEAASISGEVAGSFTYTFTMPAGNVVIGVSAEDPNALSTSYGVIPSAYTTASDYPFIVFKDGEFFMAYTCWNDLLQDGYGILDKYRSRDAETTILLRRDYSTGEDTFSSQNLYLFEGKITLDLDGHKLTRGKYHLFQVMAKKQSGKTVPTEFTIKNGTILAANSSPFVINSNGNAATLADHFYFNFENVSFGFATTSVIDMVFVTYTNGSVPTDVSAVFTDCSFVLKTDATLGTVAPTSAVTLFNLADASVGHVKAADIILKGCHILADDISLVTVYKASEGDSLKVDVSGGEYLSMTLPVADASLPGYFASVSGDYYAMGSATEDNGLYTYTLEKCDVEVTKYGVISNADYPKASYPFVLFDMSGNLIGAYDSWLGFLRYGAKLVTTESVLVLRGDYTTGTAEDNAHKSAESNCDRYLYNIKAHLTIDLSGYTLTRGSKHLLQIMSKGNSFSVTVKNGYLSATSATVIPFNDTGSSTASATINLNFENVTFLAQNTQYPFIDVYTGGVGYTANVSFTGCTFDMRGNTKSGILFNLDDGKDNTTTNKFDINLTFAGSSFLFDKTSFANMKLIDLDTNTDDSISFIGEPTTFTIPSSSTPNLSVLTRDGRIAILGGYTASGEDRVYEISLYENKTYTVGNKTIAAQYPPEIYPFALFEGDTFDKAYRSWYDFLVDVPASGRALCRSGGTLILRRDYSTSECQGPSQNIFHIDDLTIDLCGYTFTRGKNHLFQAYGKDTSTTPSHTEITVKNGRMLTENAAIIIFNNSGTVGARAEFIFTFDSVEFGFEKGSGSANLIVSNFTNGTVGSDGTVNLNNCIINLTSDEDAGTEAPKAGKVIFDLRETSGNKNFTAVNINGGEIRAESLANITLATLNDPTESGKDSISFSKSEGGNYTAFILPSGSEAPSLTANGGELVFVKIAENADTVTYRLTPKAAAELNFVPEASITLGSELTFNIYVPKHEKLTSLVLDGVSLDLGTLTEKDGYYLVTVKLGASEAARNITLAAGFSADGTSMKGTFVFSIPRYAEKVLSDSTISAVEKTLVKDVLSYIRAAYAYFGTADAEAMAKIDELLGENYDESSAPVMNGSAEKPTLGITAVTYNLTAKPGLRFYLAEGFKASDFAFSINGSAVAAEEGSDANGKYVEVKLYAYELAETVDYTVNGESDSCHIKCYYEWAKTENNDNLVKLVLRFAKYCESAAAYRESVIN